MAKLTKNISCVVCDKIIKGAAYTHYLAYSHKLGGDRVYRVCDRCDRHFSHAAFVVDQANRAFDKKV